MINKKNFLLFLIQCVLIVLIIIIISYFIKFVIDINSNAIPKLESVKQEKSTEIPDYIVVASTINKNIVLNSRSRITQTKTETMNMTIPKQFDLLISIGEAVKKNTKIASNNIEEIIIPFDARLIALTKDLNENLLLEFDLFSNYNISLILELDNFVIYKGLKNNEDNEISVQINDYYSTAKLSKFELNQEEQVYELEFDELSFNPYIFDGYEVNLYKEIEKNAECLLFPKDCVYEILTENSIVAKKVILSDSGKSAEIKDVTLIFDNSIDYDDYFCIIDADINKGNYVVE